MRKIEDCQGDLKKTWNIINGLVQNKIEEKNNNYEFKIENSSITDSNIIADKFNEYFVNIGKVLAQKISHTDKSFSSFLPNNLNLTSSCALNLCTVSEIINIVRNLKNSSSSGVDEIPVNLIKKIVDTIAEPLSLLINSSLTTGIFFQIN